MLKKILIVNRSSVSSVPALLAGLVCLATLSGCGLSRFGYRLRPSESVAPPQEPQGGYVPSRSPVQREYSPSPIPEQTPMPVPIERSLPTPVLPNDPPPPSTSEYLAPPGHRPDAVPSQPVYGERPGLISPRNARRLPQGGSERPTAAETRPDSEPSFRDGPVASRGGFGHHLIRFQQTSATR